MRVIIAGSRSIKDARFVDLAMQNAAAIGIVPTVVFSGKAPGVDKLGEQWAERHGVPVEDFPALWDKLDAPGAVVRRGRYGHLYNARAGHDRNDEMAEKADAAVLVWDGQSTGTKDMLARMNRRNKPVHVEKVGGPERAASLEV